MDSIPRLTAGELAARLNARPAGAAKWTARCPAHPDRDPSLSISEAPDGKVLLRCFAGCSFESITNALGVDPRALAGPHAKNGSQPVTPKRTQRRIVATYNYTDEGGKLLYEVVRYDPKDFRQRRPDGAGGWIWSAEGVRRIPFRLPEVRAAVAARQPVWVTEGEKDALGLANVGLCATTNAGGAGNWTSELNDAFCGAYVVILPDNDDAGRYHADSVARELHGIAEWVRILALADLPPKGDVGDWLCGKDPDAARAELKALAKTTPRFDPQAVPPVPRPLSRDKPTAQADSSAADRPLAAVPINAVPIRKIAWLWPGRLARGEITEICGDPGLGKSMLALDIAALLSRAAAWPDGSFSPEPVRSLILSAEDDPGSVIRPRLEAADADTRLIYVLPADEIVTVADADRIGELIACEHIGIVVLDPLTAFLPSRTDSHRDAEVRAAMVPVVTMARERGCAILAIRHLNKAPGLSPIYRGGGSIAFTALVRFGFAVGRHPDNRQQRVLACVKSNLGAEPPSIVFEVIPANDLARIAWLGTCDLSAEQVLNRSASDTPADDASQFLLDALADGPQPVRDIERRASALRISHRTLCRARSDLKIVTRKDAKQWVLSLPTKDANPEMTGTLPERRMPDQVCQPWHSSRGTLPAKDAKPSENGTLPDPDAFEEF